MLYLSVSESCSPRQSQKSIPPYAEVNTASRAVCSGLPSREGAGLPYQHIISGISSGNPPCCRMTRIVAKQGGGVPLKGDKSSKKIRRLRRRRGGCGAAPRGQGSAPHHVPTPPQVRSAQIIRQLRTGRVPNNRCCSPPSSANKYIPVRRLKFAPTIFCSGR